MTEARNRSLDKPESSMLAIILFTQPLRPGRIGHKVDF